MSQALAVLGFHYRNARFNFAEQFTQMANGFFTLLFLPLFMFVLSHMWKHFNGHLGNFTFLGMVAYVGVTEILFMTFIRAAIVQRSSGDFSLSLARPRSWIGLQFSACFGRVLGTRLLMILVFLPTLWLFGMPVAESLPILGRLVPLLIPLGIIQGFYHILLSCAAVRWEFTPQLALPFSKIFLVFGGVFAPLSDFAENTKQIVLLFPPADIFFQPAYFCVYGKFYGMSGSAWSLRIVAQILVLFFLSQACFRWAKRHHQSYGG